MCCWMQTPSRWSLVGKASLLSSPTSGQHQVLPGRMTVRGSKVIPLPPVLAPQIYPPHHYQNCLPQMRTLLTTLQHLALTLKTEPSWSASPPRFTPHSCSGKAAAGGPVTAEQSGPPPFTQLVLKTLDLPSRWAPPIPSSVLGCAVCPASPSL